MYLDYRRRSSTKGFSVEIARGFMIRIDEFDKVSIEKYFLKSELQILLANTILT